jgi:hypothetical protein
MRRPAVPSVLADAGFVGQDGVDYRLRHVGATGAAADAARDSATVVFEVRPGPYQVTVLDRGPGILGFTAALNARGDVVGPSASSACTASTTAGRSRRWRWRRGMWERTR